jgi:hypothetical protein
MENPSIKLGDGNWSAKDSKLLGFRPIVNKVAPIEFDVSRASTATRVNREGLIESVAANVARVDFADDVNGALLLEPQSTNLITYSEDYLNWNFTLNGGNKIATTLLNGLNGVNISASNNRQVARFLISVTSGVAYNFSAYFENVIGDLFRPIIGISGGSITGTTIITKSDVINGGRFSISFTPNFTGNIILLVGVGTDNNDSGSFSVSALQLEQSSVATSYTPTNGTTVTRLADVVGKTGISDLINGEEGVLFLNSAALANNTTPRFIELSGNTVSLVNNVFIRYESFSNRMAYSVYANSSLQCNISFDLNSQSDYNKMAFVWATNRFEIWVNGSKVSEDTSGIAPAANFMSRIKFSDRNGNNKFDGNVKGLQIYNTALTDSQLTQLTTI